MKKIKILALVLMAVVLCAALAGCGGSDNSSNTTNTNNTNNTSNTSELTVTFDYNYEGSPEAITMTAKSGEIIEPPQAARENYSFDGWYSDANLLSKYDFEDTAITRDLTVYASWIRASYSFTIKYNAELEDSVSEVAVGSTAERPATPEREGYLFRGWYTDAECTAEYDFSTVVSDDTTIYAGWEEDSGDNVRIKLMWNYSGSPEELYDTLTMKKGTRGQNVTPEREGYYFNGWYTNPEGTGDAYELTGKQNENTTLYADWLIVNTFEAEYIDLSEVVGHGISGTAYGKDVIVKDTFGANASNGYYVGWLYNQGITLVFNIHSDEAVSKAKLALRLSAEVQNTTIDGNDFVVMVNDRAFAYSIEFTNVPSTGSGTKLPFETYIISNKVSLNEGDNTILLYVNNNKDYGFTVNANAPMVDAVYIYSKNEISWAEGYPLEDNLVGIK